MASWMKGRADWARVYSRIEAARAGAAVPPPTARWHEALNTGYYAGLSAHPFHAATDPWWTPVLAEAVAHLERFYPVIKAELLSLRRGELTQYRQPHGSGAERATSADGVSALLHENGACRAHPPARPTQPDRSPRARRACALTAERACRGAGDWKVLYLQQEGGDTARNEALAPKTAKIVRSVVRAAGHALFSAMEPDTHILPHCGPTNGRLRLHLGLVVPEVGAAAPYRRRRAAAPPPPRDRCAAADRRGRRPRVAGLRDPRG
jgi:hypothetical protein